MIKRWLEGFLLAAIVTVFVLAFVAGMISGVFS
jgi:hypothetical protein